MLSNLFRYLSIDPLSPYEKYPTSGNVKPGASIPEVTTKRRMDSNMYRSVILWIGELVAQTSRSRWASEIELVLVLQDACIHFPVFCRDI